MFARALHFDEVLRVLHHDVHVDIGGGVFYIAQVAERLAIDDTYGNGGNAVLENLLRDAEAFLDFLERDGEGDKTADDACCAGAAVSFDDVAIDDDCVLAEGGEIGGTAEGTAHQALDFLRAATGTLALAFHALARALREQGVFGGNPARAAAGEPVGDLREEGCVADDAGASHLDEHGTVGTGDEAGGHLEVAVFVKFAVGTFVSHNCSNYQSSIINYQLITQLLRGAFAEASEAVHEVAVALEFFQRFDDGGVFRVAFEGEMEYVFPRAVGMRAALDAGEVQVALGKATECCMERTGSAGIAQHEQQSRLDFARFGEGVRHFLDGIKPGEVHPRQVLDALGQNVEAIELAGVGARDRAYGFIATLGDFFGTACGVVESRALDVRVAPEKAAALGKALRVAQHFLDVLEFCPGESAKAVRNLQLDFAHDGVAPLVQQIVVVVDGTRGGVFDGNGPAVHGAGLDALENLLEGIHRDDFDIVSEQMVGGAFAVGPATALKCDFLHSGKDRKRGDRI